jgi:hypothetical protein
LLATQPLTPSSKAPKDAQTRFDATHLADGFFGFRMLRAAPQ